MNEVYELDKMFKSLLERTYQYRLKDVEQGPLFTTIDLGDTNVGNNIHFTSRSSFWCSISCKGSSHGGPLARNTSSNLSKRLVPTRSIEN